MRKINKSGLRKVRLFFTKYRCLEPDVNKFIAGLQPHEIELAFHTTFLRVPMADKTLEGKQMYGMIWLGNSCFTKETPVHSI